jgi:transposase
MGTRSLSELPDDVDALKAIITRQDAQLEMHRAELEAQRAKLAILEHNYHLMRKWAFAKKSERRPLHPVDVSSFQGPLLFPEIIEAAERVADETGACGDVDIGETVDRPPAPTKPKKRGRRSTFPEHLPVIRTTFELPAEDRKCGGCGHDMNAIGEETTKELERVEFTVVHEIARKKYSCKVCQSGVKTAPGPDRVIDRGLLGVGFLAHLVTERFGNHMPYNRLEKKYESEGLDLSRSVLSASAGRVAEILKPIATQVRKEILASGYVQTDDTGVLKLEPPAKEAADCEFWAYRSPEVGAVFYDFVEPKVRDGPIEVLRDYEGYLQADAHRCYEPLYKSGDIKEVACWAHARRRFVDAESAEPDFAKEAVDRIREIYVIEKRAKDEGLSAEARQELRQRESIPRLQSFADWMTATLPKVLEKGPIGTAISYAQKNWAALNRYVEDGRLEIDNNGAERALRSVAVGRKNWTFLGSDAGGETAATLLTLVMSAKETGIDPRLYIRDVLLRIGRCSDVTTLTPKGWKAHWLPEVDAHRQSIIERMFATRAEVLSSPALA